MQTALAPTRKDDPAKVLLIGGVLAAGGYLAYRYVYLPAKMKEDLQLAMLQAGAPAHGNPLQVLGAGVCQAYGAKYGIPPGASVGICGELAGAAAQVIQQLPQLIGGVGYGVGQGLTYIGEGAGNVLSSVGGGLGAGIQGAAGGIAGGAVALGTAPIKIVGGTVAPVYGAGKTVVKDIYGGVKTVLSDLKSAGKSLLPWNW